MSFLMASYSADVPSTQSYKKNDINKPAFYVGVALPSEQE
jgi:hypothetical protein